VESGRNLQYLYNFKSHKEEKLTQVASVRLNQNMKKPIKPYSSLLRRYAGLLFAPTFHKNWIHSVTSKKRNATFIIKTLIFMILNRIFYLQAVSWENCGQVNNYFLQNLSKPYILFQGISYICRRVLGNWGVAFCNGMIVNFLTLLDYLKLLVSPSGRRLYYAELKLVPISSNGFSQFYSKGAEC